MGKECRRFKSQAETSVDVSVGAGAVGGGSTLKQTVGGREQNEATCTLGPGARVTAICLASQ